MLIVVFSEYNPGFVPTEGLSEIVDDTNRSIDDDAGAWRLFGYGIASIYRSDFDAIGGFNVSIKGWGLEDVDLFERALNSSLYVVRAADPALRHIYHPVACSAHLSLEQYRMCLGSKANGFASRRVLERHHVERTRPPQHQRRTIAMTTKPPRQ